VEVARAAPSEAGQRLAEPGIVVGPLRRIQRRNHDALTSAKSVNIAPGMRDETCTAPIQQCVISPVSPHAGAPYPRVTPDPSDHAPDFITARCPRRRATGWVAASSRLTFRSLPDLYAVLKSPIPAGAVPLERPSKVPGLPVNQRV
jgi:hypothetical protein